MNRFFLNEPRRREGRKENLVDNVGCVLCILSNIKSVGIVINITGNQETAVPFPYNIILG
ncbi:hypothetical protein [Microcoleus sp. K4-B3]|uniref:hypothetical protein n=1 Tax=Microcoleus sp. K4-B3 TaxID=2818791 RepID=UPI002FCF0B85